jgi:3-oxoacyl-[acyl-carrier protein] reductase/7-alpha-hydroxysteroid dehydrogenase
MRLKNKVAIITGGSRGIGFATADLFLKEGATVIVAASRPETAAKAVEELKALHPDATVDGISPDLAILDDVRSAFNKVIDQYGGVDILVNNAGMSDSTPFVDYTEETYDKVMDLNIKGAFNATRAVVDNMEARGGGVVLSTSSMVSITGQPALPTRLLSMR